jgi:hypothetical protein
MNTLEVDKFLKKYKWIKNSYCGVLPIDKLPLKKIKKPCSFVINTDKSTNSGKHWFAIYVPVKGPIEYFDSYGLKPINPEIYRFFKENDNKWIYNKYPIQSLKSQSCGKFSILFIAYRSKGLSMKDYTKLFSVNKDYNENVINILFYKLYKYI